MKSGVATTDTYALAEVCELEFLGAGLQPHRGLETDDVERAETRGHDTYPRRSDSSLRIKGQAIQGFGESALIALCDAISTLRYVHSSEAYRLGETLIRLRSAEGGDHRIGSQEIHGPPGPHLAEAFPQDSAGLAVVVCFGDRMSIAE